MTCGGLVAQRTVFGWMLSGSYLCREDRWGNGHNQNTLMQKTFPNQVLFCQTGLFEYQVRNLWELDAVGISGSEDHQPDTVLTRFNKDIEFKAKRYTVKLPWKSEDCKQSLIDNRDIAEKRV